MIYGAVPDMATNNLRIAFNPIASGLETSLQWKKSNFKLELEYDEGF
jgi:hypothetical protein